VTANVFDTELAGALEEQLRADFSAARELGPDWIAGRPVLWRLVAALAYRLRAWL
jgi:hypothetical protein